jgi:hypothetical protein
VLAVDGLELWILGADPVRAVQRVVRMQGLWGSRSRPELVTCSDRRPTLQA